MSLGLVGLGYWGVNYLNALIQLENISLKYVCDVDRKKLVRFPGLQNNAKVFDYTSLASDEGLDAVIVATPASTHYPIAKLMLESGKHVLVEKPMTMSYEQAKDLCKLSKKVDRILMVGHIYCFNAAVKYMKDMLEDGRLGSLYYGIGLRLGPGPIRSDASCTWDLATHDVSMLDYLINEMPESVSAHATSFLQRGIYDYAAIQLNYKSGFCFSLITSWYAAEKIRTWHLMGSSGMLNFDDLRKGAPVTVYNKGVDIHVAEKRGIRSIVPKEGDVFIPYIRYDEPLLQQIKHFIYSVRHGTRPLTSCEQGVKVVSVLESIEVSITNHGAPVRVTRN